MGIIVARCTYELYSNRKVTVKYYKLAVYVIAVSSCSSVPPPPILPLESLPHLFLAIEIIVPKVSSLVRTAQKGIHFGPISH